MRKPLFLYNAATKVNILDRRQSGDTSFSKDFASVESVQLNPASDMVNVRILVDKSIVEVFVNDGEYVFTYLVFPKLNEGAVELFAEKGKANFSDISVKQVKKSIH